MHDDRVIYSVQKIIPSEISITQLKIIILFYIFRVCIGDILTSEHQKTVTYLTARQCSLSTKPK